MWNLKKQNPKNQPHRYREQISGCQRCGGGGEMGKGSQKEQAPSSKINKSWGCMYSMTNIVNTVLHI